MSLISNHQGFSLVEVVIAIVVASMILGALLSLHTASERTFAATNKVSDTKELSKLNMAQLEWLFQRWGTSTPCNDPTGSNQCTPVIDCRVNNQLAYPPPSSVCITIVGQSPCDEVTFYASLHGNGFIDRIASQTTVAAMSCRLSQAANRNCYHIKRGGPFRRDASDNNNALIFAINGLSSNDLDCINVAGNSNVTINRQVTALNGFELDAGNNQVTNMNLEGGDLLLRVPHRVRLFCQNNPNDNNQLWLYMEAFDTSNDCNADEAPAPLVPVNSFTVRNEGQGVRVTTAVRGPDNNTMTVQRFFGR